MPLIISGAGWSLWESHSKPTNVLFLTFGVVTPIGESGTVFCVKSSEMNELPTQIVAPLSRQLVSEFGRGFADKNLRRMMQFAEAFPDEEIVATLSRQLSWSHLKELLPLGRPHQREFYAEMNRIEGWSVRTLRERIDSMLYERTALSKQPDELVKQELAMLRTRGDVTP